MYEVNDVSTVPALVETLLKYARETEAGLDGFSLPPTNSLGGEAANKAYLLGVADGYRAAATQLQSILRS